MHCRQKLWEMFLYVLQFKQKNRVMDFISFNRFKCIKVSLLGLQFDESVKF